MLLHPRGLLGLSDGGAHTGTICDASMPTFMLTHWTRDRARGATLPLEYVVKKQTHDTARLYGLSDRGTVEPGALGDLNVIDYDASAAPRPVRRRRPPGRGPPPAPAGHGVRATIKKGVVTFEDGEPTGELPGRLAPRGRAEAHGRGRPPGRPQRYGRAAHPVRGARRHPHRLPGVGAGPADPPVDVLEFNSGLMISIDETVDEPNWLRYTERVAGFCRLIRFDAGGLGLSDPLPSGHVALDRGLGARRAGRHGRGRVRARRRARPRAAARCPPLAGGHAPRAGGVARHRQRDGEGGRGRGLRLRRRPTRSWRPRPTSTCPKVEGDVPQDIAVFAPSLAHRVGFREWWERAARRGASPATAVAFNLVTFSADVRSCLPDIRCPTLVVSRTESYATLQRHGRYLAEHIEGARFVTIPGARPAALGGRVRRPRRRDRGVRDRAAGRCTATRDRWPPSSSPTSWTRRSVRPRDGDRHWRAVLDELDVTTQRLLARHDGVLVKTTGDGILARFASPAQALRCATDMVEAASSRRPGAARRCARRRGGAERGRHRWPGRPHRLAGERHGGPRRGADDRDRARPRRRARASASTTAVFTTLKGVPGEWQLLAVERA